MSDIDKVKQLREATGAGFKDCNLAVKESGGDLDKAVEILRVKGISKASKKMSRDAKEGVIATSGNENKISVIELNCETDFVAKNDDFVLFAKELSELNNKNDSDLDKLNKSNMLNNKTVEDNLISLIAKMGEKITVGKTKTFNQAGAKNFNYLHTIVKDNLSKLSVIASLETSDDSEAVKTFGKQLSMHIAASNPLALSSDLIDKDILQKEQDLVTEELKSSGKPEEIIQKISLGKMSKFKEENALLTQAWVMEPKKKVQDIVKELNIPDLKINNFFRIKDKEEAKASVTFLNAQIAQTNFSEIKQVIAQLLQQKTQQLTLIEVSDFYVFEYLDPPAVMERKSEPRRSLICIFGTFLGGLFSILIVIIRHYAFNTKFL